MSNIREDLILFSQLAEYLLKLEEEQPVPRPVSTDSASAKPDLTLGDDPVGDENFKKTLGELIEKTPKTASKLFFNQLFGGRMSRAVLGDLLAVLLNNSMYTYKAAGPQVQVEKEVIRRSCELAGFGSDADGVFAPGGSMSNLMALITARDQYNERFKHTGISGDMTAYTSRESHYSLPKNMGFTGLGRNNLRYIDTDDRGAMKPGALALQIEKDLAEGYRPFFVNATSGTTVLGAFDPLEPIADVCEKYNLFLHVDGAYCGSVIFSEKYRHLIDGIERADSFSYNAHKLLAAPLTCSLLLVKNGEALFDAFGHDADYLFQTEGDEYNPGKKSMQCGRRNDALKLWTLWKSMGTKGLGKIIEHQFRLADTARDYINSHPDYTLHSFENSISVCFNYKGIDAVTLCRELYEHGEIMVSHGSFRDKTFVRFVTINPANTEDDIMNFFHTLEAFAERILQKQTAEC